MMKVMGRNSFNMKTNSMKVDVIIQLLAKHTLRQDTFLYSQTE